MTNIYYDFENFDYTSEEEEKTDPEQVFDEYYNKYEETYDKIIDTIYNSNNNTLLFDMTIDNLISFVESGECPDIRKVINDVNGIPVINQRLFTHVPKKITSGWEFLGKKNKKVKKVKKVKKEEKEKEKQNKMKKYKWTNKKIKKEKQNLKLIQEEELTKKEFELEEPIISLRPTKEEYRKRSKSPKNKLKVKSNGFNKRKGGFRVNKSRPDRM
jgi:hypothetical protein